VLTHTVADVGTSIVTEASARVLEVVLGLDLGQIRAGKISRSTKELWEDGGKGSEDDLRELAGGDGAVSGLVDGEGLLPVFRELASNAAGELGVLFGILLAIGGEELGPLLLELSTTLAELAIKVVGSLGNSKLLLRVEAPLGLQGDDVVSLES
jgi:hypothetical protein